MSLGPDQTDGVRKEAELRPSVNLLFVGYNHEPLNIQAIPRISQRIDEVFTSTPGRKVLFLENAGASHEDARRVESGVRDFGFRNYLVPTILAAQGIAPSKLGVRSFILETERQIDSGGALAFPLKFLQSYYLHRELDRLRDKHGFDIKFESHSPDILRRDIQSSSTYKEFMVKAEEAWKTGDFEAFLRNERSALTLIRANGALRDQEITEDLGRIATRMFQDGKGGAIAMIMGESHASLADSIPAKAKKAKFKTIKSLAIADIDPRAKAIDAISKGAENADELVVQAGLAGIVGNALINSLIQAGESQRVMAHFEEYVEAIGITASGFSLEEVKQICVEKGNAGQIVWDRYLSQGKGAVESI